jgi:ribosomal protein L22
MKAARKRSKEKLEADRKEQEASLTRGSLASSSPFATELKRTRAVVDEKPVVRDVFEDRNPATMAQALNPDPDGRLRWQRDMVIKEVQKRGRLTRKVRLARTEREHSSRSHFFKTSMKKLAPLARQIAGKSIDAAILQMRFSNKKVAQEVRQHLIQARNEAIVVKGMGLGRVGADNATDLQIDPAESPPLPHQTALKTLKKGEAIDPTDMYIAQAWTNRGPYGREPDYRARGRMYIKRPPSTGITVMLKEEKTRTREANEKEAKRLRKRTGKNMWKQLPDRPVTAQRQHVLW